MHTGRKLRGHAFGMVGLLIAQYVLGMLANLYVQFPENQTEWQMWDFAKTQPLILTHIALGMLLLFGTLVLVIRAINAKNRPWRIASGLAFGSIVLAIVSGSEFITTQNDWLSLAMSLFFIVALVS